MKRSLALVFGLLLALSSLLPQYALAADSVLGTIKPITSRNVNFVRTWNGKPIRICQWRQESWERAHQTCHELITGAAGGTSRDLVAGRVTDFIRYDGMTYDRENNDTIWISRKLTGSICNLECELTPSGNTYTVEEMPRTVRNGVPVRHFKFWSTDKDLNAQVEGMFINEYFISDDGTLVSRTQVVTGNIPGLGQGELSNIWVYSNINTDIKIGRPDPSVVKPGN